MPKNPFQTENPKEISLHKRIERALGKSNTPLNESVNDDSLSDSSNTTNKTNTTNTVKEEAILQRLSRRNEKEIKHSVIQPCMLFNRINATIALEQKKEIETSAGCSIYYQAPETHNITKENGKSFNCIFLNWRKALTDLFSRYRKACIHGQSFSFFVYTDEAICFFHVSGCNGCESICCGKKDKYALSIRCKDKNHYLFSEKDFLSDGNDNFYLSGTGVLFVLDIIINFEASSVQALPFVISKHFFLNAISSQPQLFFHQLMQDKKPMYNLIIRGWLQGEDAQVLNNASNIKADIRDK